jgi:hypothetical protein
MAQEMMNERPVDTELCSAEMNARKRLIEAEPVFEAINAKRQRTGNYGE